ncbi:hypothetical protein BFP76_11025 [Amylibacter kogurei]|uniref:Uncharacterized protein n=2 Tax=Paramylibacter kogurei TaxID=1889778 RepID=A0A2G5KAA2_9RHOB|nr:hypothetical protein BFP76_11025 [Amylibacter kogurei]
MATTHAVTKAFAMACRNSPEKITPHSAKHSIAAERDRRRLSHEQRKAWSENIGHDNETITEQYYGKLSDDRRFELLEEVQEDQISPPLNLSDEAKIEMANEFLK